jgi:hypothetical protein
MYCRDTCTDARTSARCSLTVCSQSQRARS